MGWLVFVGIVVTLLASSASGSQINKGEVIEGLIEEFTNSRGLTYARIYKYGNDLELRDWRYNIIGTYDGDEDCTYDSNSRFIGYGNQLYTLIEDKE